MSAPLDVSWYYSRGGRFLHAYRDGFHVSLCGGSKSLAHLGGMAAEDMPLVPEKCSSCARYASGELKQSPATLLRQLERSERLVQVLRPEGFKPHTTRRRTP